MINAISQIVKTTTWSAIFLCLFCISPHLQAQESKMRSWLNDWQNTTLPDSVRFEAIDKLVMKGYRITNSDSALFYVDKQLAFAKGEKNKKWIAEATVQQRAHTAERIRVFSRQCNVPGSAGDPGIYR